MAVDSLPSPFNRWLLFNENVCLLETELTSPLRIRLPQVSRQSHRQASQSDVGAACPQAVCLWGGAPLPGRPGVWNHRPPACGPFSSCRHLGLTTTGGLEDQ